MYSNKQYQELLDKLNIKFKNIENFKKAFYIKKIPTVNGKLKDNYENCGLATLGDSILKTYLSIELYSHGIIERGLITKTKEDLEKNMTLLQISDSWELHKYVYDEHGGTVNRDPRLQIANSQKIRSTLVEAIVGSLYIDSGIDVVLETLKTAKFLEIINNQIPSIVSKWKTL
ncbi:MAG: ribonuclease III domain-containing protein [Mycoplasma sp.]